MLIAIASSIIVRVRSSIDRTLRILRWAAVVRVRVDDVPVMNARVIMHRVVDSAVDRRAVAIVLDGSHAWRARSLLQPPLAKLCTRARVRVRTMVV